MFERRKNEGAFPAKVHIRSSFRTMDKAANQNRDLISNKLVLGPRKRLAEKTHLSKHQRYLYLDKLRYMIDTI